MSRSRKVSIDDVLKGDRFLEIVSQPAKLQKFTSAQLTVPYGPPGGLPFSTLRSLKEQFEKRPTTETELSYEAWLNHQFPAGVPDSPTPFSATPVPLSPPRQLNQPPAQTNHIPQTLSPPPDIPKVQSPPARKNSIKATRKEVAAAISSTIHEVDNLIENRTFKTKGNGTGKRILWDSVDQYLASLQGGPTVPKESKDPIRLHQRKTP